MSRINILEDMISDEYVVQQDLYLSAAAYIFLRNTSDFSLINLRFSSEKSTFLASDS